MVFELAICTNVLDAFLVRRVTARTGVVPFAAIVMGSASVVSKASRVKGGQSSGFGLQAIGFCGVEVLYFAEIVAPACEARFDAVQHGSMKGQHCLPVVFGRQTH